ncbi:predicted protein [Botrytis cinerea T4]|uniref:Uncharacterized protein n=1 Tax=Botryotinia fuckeliana (strain T4) TaxID=999810 RepID=G2YNI0_BOTF4|nr:predicted protein [Botrytis cinerea T4]
MRASESEAFFSFSPENHSILPSHPAADCVYLGLDCVCRSATGGKEKKKKKEQEKEKEKEKKEKRKEEKKYHASVQPPELVGRSQRCGWMIDCTRFDKMVPYHTHTCMHASICLSI